MPNVRSRLLLALPLILFSSSSIAGIIWLNDERGISGSTHVACSVCPTFEFSDSDSVVPFTTGGVVLDGFPGTATSDPGGVGVALGGEPRVTLITSAFTPTDSFVVTGMGNSWAIAAGSQNGTAETGSAETTALSFLDVLFQIDRPYRTFFFGEISIAAGAIPLTTRSLVELTQIGLSDPLFSLTTSTPGEQLTGTFDEVLGPGTYRMRSFASAFSTQLLPPDFFIRDNQASFTANLNLAPIPPTPVAESGSLALFGLAAVAGLALLRRRRHQSSSEIARSPANR